MFKRSYAFIVPTYKLTHRLSQLTHRLSHKHKTSLLFILALTLFIGFTLSTMHGQYKPNLHIYHDGHQLVVIPPNSKMLTSPQPKKISQIVIDNKAYTVKPNWLTSDLQGMQGVGNFQTFYRGESVLNSAVFKPSYIMAADGSTYPLKFEPLTLRDYGTVFITSRISAFILLMFPLWIYYLAPQHRGAIVAIIGSYAFAIAFMVADTSIERQWAINADKLYFFITLSEVGTIIYTASAFYLVWFLPKPLSKQALLNRLPVAVFIALLTIYALHFFGIISSYVMMFEAPYLIVHIVIILILLTKFIYYYQYKEDFILEWVTIRWVMLTTTIGVSVPLFFTLAILFGQIDKLPPYTFESIIIFKVGLSALVASSVLYQLESFWWRLWVFIIATAVTISLLLIGYYIKLPTTYSVAIGLFGFIVCTVLTYHNLKGKYVLDTARAIEDVLPKMLAINQNIDFVDTSTKAVNLPSLGHSPRLKALIHVFRPLKINYLPVDDIRNASQALAAPHDIINKAMQSHEHRPHSDSPQDSQAPQRPLATITKGGASITIIDLDGSLIELSGANKGLRLFTKKDIGLITSFLKIMKQHQHTQNSFIKGEAHERKRIAADLHDDIGGKLLYLASREGELGAYAHETLQDLRILARGLSSDSKPLEDVLADISYTLAQKCELEAIDFKLVSTIDDFSTQCLNPRDATTLTSILNELSRNARRHNNVTFITCHLAIANMQLNILFCNDGDSVDPSQWHKGLGIPSITRRINNWGGSIIWEARSAGGVDCRISIPIRALFGETTFAN